MQQLRTLFTPLSPHIYTEVLSTSGTLSLSVPALQLSQVPMSALRQVNTYIVTTAEKKKIKVAKTKWHFILEILTSHFSNILMKFIENNSKLENKQTEVLLLPLP